MAQNPMAMHSAIRPEAAWAWLAPTAASPCSTTANELAVPTKAASRPALSAWRVGVFFCMALAKSWPARWQATGWQTTGVANHDRVGLVPDDLAKGRQDFGIAPIL